MNKGLPIVFIGLLSLIGKARNMPAVEKVEVYPGLF
jgi:hypothetical protein